MERNKKVDKLYQEYIKEKLDLIFNGENSEVFSINIGRQSPKKYCPQIVSHEEYKGNLLYKYEGHGRMGPNYICDYVTEFIDGLALVRKYDWFNKTYYYGYINVDGSFLFSRWYDVLEPFSDGFAKVGDIGYKDKDEIIKYNFKDKKNNCLFEKWLDKEPHSFSEGFALIFYSNGKCNYVNTKGEKLLKEDIAKGCDFRNGCAKISYDGNKYTFIDKNGHVVLPVGKYKNDYLEQTLNFYVVDGKVIPKNVDLGGCKVKKGFFGYKCDFFSSKFKMKYQPIKRYGLRYFLCFKNNDVYLYDRFGNSYSLLGTIFDVEYDDNFIFDKKNDQIYLVYEDRILNITDYYRKNLAEKSEVSISKGVKEILSREEFSFNNMTKIDEMMSEERKKNAQIRVAQEEQQKINTLKKKKEEDERIEIECQKNRKEALRQLKEILKVLSETSKTGKTSRIIFSDIFMEVGNHKEINPEMLGLLKYIELGYINFDNVKVDGIDFRGCNIDMKHRFNPQKVYGKSLRNCNFEGIHLSLIPIDFSGVDIRGCRFGKDDDYMTRDVMPESFKDAIYDETTTYNGQPLTEILTEEKKK